MFRYAETKKNGRVAVVLVLMVFLFMACFANTAFADVYGGGSSPAPTPEPTPITQTVKTDDDKAIDEALRETGAAVVAGKAAVQLSAGTVSTLTSSGTALSVSNEGATLNFGAQSLNTQTLQNAQGNDNATVNIGVRQVTGTEKDNLISNATAAGSGLIAIGTGNVNMVFEFKAEVTTTNTDGTTSTQSIGDFSEPVLVVIDLSNVQLTAEEIAQLSAVRMGTNQALGGTYDPVTQTFSFYTTNFSLYTVMKKPDLVNLTLTVGSKETLMNGKSKAIDVPPTIIQNRTMVPLRYIGEAFGATFAWNEATRTVTYTYKGKTLKLVIDVPSAGMDVAATIRDGRTLVPIRYCSESFGAEVMWFPSTRKVTVVK
ncbi:MAG: hypothetical protein CVU87_11030 [Firmicutes bacterium HGW-Firmicutes-12]|jgi:hypothetical protein|nr:MAG: hypothetical protein CVU87_11030 [Firmicutes bacterium HGW-Firmicutes-12]